MQGCETDLPDLAQTPVQAVSVDNFDGWGDFEVLFESFEPGKKLDVVEHKLNVGVVKLVFELTKN